VKKLHYFIGTKHSPYHLSVGAVVMNRAGKVYVHRFPRGPRNPEFFLLMRETVDPGESLAHALARGLKEEFDMRAKLVAYLGSIVSSFTNWEKARVEKTTLYFLCASATKTTARVTSAESRGGHFGKGSIREWRDPRFLISQMKKQGKRMKRSDFDESVIVERTVKFRKGAR
jgi:hypothetical protein